MPRYSHIPGEIPQNVELSINHNFTAGLPCINETQKTQVKIVSYLKSYLKITQVALVLIAILQTVQ